MIQVGKVKIINKTLHPVKIQLPDGKVVSIDPDIPPFRLHEVVESESTIAGLPIVHKKYIPDGEVPEKQKDVYYIVSALVKLHYPDRNDFLAPDTGLASAVRDRNGCIIAVRRLMQ